MNLRAEKLSVMKLVSVVTQSHAGMEMSNKWQTHSSRLDADLLNRSVNQTDKESR